MRQEDEFSLDGSELHGRLKNILKEAKSLREKIKKDSFLSKKEKRYWELQIGGISSIASDRADHQSDDILSFKPKIIDAEVRLKGVEKKVEQAIQNAMIKSVRNDIEFYIYNHLSYSKNISDIYTFLMNPEETGDSKQEKIKENNIIIDLIRKENERSRNIERENTIAELLVETEKYIEKKQGKLENKQVNDKSEESNTLSNTRKKLEFAQDLKKILVGTDAPEKKLAQVENHINSEKASSFIKHRNVVKRNTENFLERIANLLDNLAQRLSGKGRVKSKEEESHSNLQSPPSRFFAPPRSAKLMADWCNKVNALQHRLTN